ncbi:MAG TPA: molybdate ABC transporter substrate-binding protein [Stellaceae bacterium]|nr:molybdate ABC transporter substrate-binding protein [Stellaceae bacterium]
MKKLIAAFLLVLLAAWPAGAADQVLVFAAASLKNALDEAAGAYDKGGGTIAVSYAASSALAKELENGAPADLFISADVDWMEYAVNHHLVLADKRRDLLGNTLVLIAPASSKVAIELKSGVDLAGALDGGRLAIADPQSVPAGKYAKESLTALGVWGSLEGRLARAEDVRAALRFVSRGEAPLGIVYRTDANADPGVRVVGVFPEGTHKPIIYPMALTLNASSEAARFADFLQSPAARMIFEKYGFTVLR